MKIIDILRGWIDRSASTTVNPEQWFIDYFKGGQPTKAGVTVNNDTALQLSTYFACVKDISEDVAKLPLKTYRPLKPQGKEILTDHPLYRILHDEANPEMSAFTFRDVLTAHCLNWGNGYAFIERKRFNEIVALWPILPDKVKPFRDDRTRLIMYEVTDDKGNKEVFGSFDILHIPGLGYDGIMGYNVARYARECLGTITAAEQHGAFFFSNGSNANGILEIPAAMSEKARSNLKESFHNEYSGVKNSGKTIVLEEGCKFNKTSIPPEEAQFLETRQYSVPEICRWFRMPPNKVADMTRAQGWSTLEQTNTDYVTDTLMPWFVRWEQEIARKLLSRDEKKQGIFVRHLANALLRGDIAARTTSYTAGRNGGWYCVDDIREMEDLNPLPDDKGQIYLQPLNMVEAGTEPEPPAPIEQPQEPQPKEEETEAIFSKLSLLELYDKNINNKLDVLHAEVNANGVANTTLNASVFEEVKSVGASIITKLDDKMPAEPVSPDKLTHADDCAERIASSEIREIEKHIEHAKDDGFSKWLDEFYIKHERYCIRTLMPLVGLKDASVLAMTLIDDFKFEGGDFETFKKEAALKHKEFLHAILK